MIRLDTRPPTLPRAAKRVLGAFYTPPRTAAYMVQKLGHIGQTERVLEPCGGEGVFVEALIASGVDPSQIHVWDINASVAERMRSYGVHFEQADVLKERADFSPLFCETFDYAIGNPPYLNKQSTYIRRNRSLLQVVYREIGASETYAMFLYNTLRHLRDGGRLCFIVSDTLLSLGTHARLRKFILDSAKIVEILLAPKNLFSRDGASVRTCIVTLEKLSGKEHQDARSAQMMRLVPRVSGEEEYESPPEVYQLPQRDYAVIAGSPFFLRIHPRIAEIFRSAPRITGVIDGHIGMHTHDNRRFIAALAGSGVGAHGGRIITAEEATTGAWQAYIKTGGNEQYWSPIVEFVAWDDESRKRYDMPGSSLFLREGIVVAGVSSRLAARYMPPGCVWESNKAIGFVVTSSRVSIQYMLGVLNSKLYNYFVKGILNTSSSVQIEDLRRLPFIFPPASLREEVERAVSTILAGKRAGTELDYPALRAKIDELIFDLYDIPAAFRVVICQHY